MNLPLLLLGLAIVTVALLLALWLLLRHMPVFTLGDPIETIGGETEEGLREYAAKVDDMLEGKPLDAYMRGKILKTAVAALIAIAAAACVITLACLYLRAR